MIIGIGTDIVEIERIEKAINRNLNFINKLFTKNEIEYFKSRNMRSEFIAGRFAAKEAVSKALGTGFRGFEFKDIEIENNILGKPMVNLKGKAKKMDKKWGNYKIHLSISHGRENAIAYAVLEVVDNGNYNSSKDEGYR
ncbi:4'-phosphopantetheinyl transferase [Clostridium novyi B str. ATCC 27606]|uniref:Holo-[acyl-carrier-protein] synthase n=2 Tax=Clostridium TaxID=1485 RepID=A0AA40M5G5_CLONO|nr:MULTISPECIES: holo-ACP synthase [Clostridium]KEI13525.1 4'-phosphopantetheinyl transferase [Clostridium novyi B str. NCTC 9691]KEI14809.1 4'-phosphopantetheinyl transferase [Clostridium novyi B str. ATCC 27606]KEI16657.1 4'-phosphopantetheinyl transferase [Clostridium haemolyticum NCTC 9693]KGN04116.1 4'-phosphopantetheinyl transferase [Clostridium haemolyticum NCTC 8350]OOB76332.1 4'-phosphopantetheinyl transferase [Clostridium haemolyticum]